MGLLPVLESPIKLQEAADAKEINSTNDGVKAHLCPQLPREKVRIAGFCCRSAEEKPRSRPRTADFGKEALTESVWGAFDRGSDHGDGRFCCPRGQSAVLYLGCATHLDRIAFAGKLGEEGFAILSDVGKFR